MDETTEMTVCVEDGMTELDMRSPAVHLSNGKEWLSWVVQRSRRTLLPRCLVSEKKLGFAGQGQGAKERVEVKESTSSQRAREGRRLRDSDWTDTTWVRSIARGRDAS